MGALPSLDVSHLSSLLPPSEIPLSLLPSSSIPTAFSTVWDAFIAQQPERADRGAYVRWRAVLQSTIKNEWSDAGDAHFRKSSTYARRLYLRSSSTPHQLLKQIDYATQSRSDARSGVGGVKVWTAKTAGLLCAEWLGSESLHYKPWPHLHKLFILSQQAELRITTDSLPTLSSLSAVLPSPILLSPRALKRHGSSSPSPSPTPPSEEGDDSDLDAPSRGRRAPVRLRLKRQKTMSPERGLPLEEHTPEETPTFGSLPRNFNFSFDLRDQDRSPPPGP
ncbi:hypothetical protein JCM6882_009395 [Rhodosporidiobolus microsporus]